MVDPAGSERLALEPRAERRVSLIEGMQDLHRDGLLQITVNRPVHAARRAASEQLLELELAAADRLAEEWIGRRFRHRARDLLR